MSIEQEMKEAQQAAKRAELKEVWMRAWVATIMASETANNPSARDLSYKATYIADECINAYTERFRE